MTKLHDDFVAEIGTSANVDDNVHSMLNTIADRIDACGGNRVKLSDLTTILREDPKAVSVAVQKVTPVPATKAEKAEAEAADKAAADKKIADDKAAADKKAVDDKAKAGQLQPA